MSDWIISFVARLGSLGVFTLMLLENVFPPIPSELIMPLSGYHARTGEMNLWVVILAGTLGSLAGTCFWYALGRKVDEERMRRWIDRHGRWLTITTEELDRSKAWFERRGGSAVFFCRLIPALRSVISLPAGISRMPVSSFLLYTSAGTFLWTAALAYAGYLLGGAYAQVSEYLGPVSTAIIALSVLTYIWRVIRQSQRRVTTSSER
jgi:membrane protein DedA with SNARE-associated domain